MENEKGKRASAHTRTFLPIFPFLFSLFVLFSCGTPGDPRPPRAIVPVAVSDFSARQQGSAVVLSFTLPTRSAQGDLLDAPPQVEIFRSYLTAPAPAGDVPAPATIAYTIPEPVVSTYLQPDGRFIFTDPVKPEDLQARAGKLWVYAVRTRASTRRASDASNVVALLVLPVPAPPEAVVARLTEQAIELNWRAPAQSGGAGVVAYRVYRRTVMPDAPPEAKDVPPVLLAPTAATSYRDAQFEFGRTYFYTVVSVAQHDTASVESAPSAPVEVAARDAFAPAPPANLVVVVIPATADAPAQFDLSWGIGAEADLAGYNIYRSELEGTLGTRLNSELLLAPAFRDISVAPGKRYFYRVTAVDRSGNESAPSLPAAETIPASGL